MNTKRIAAAMAVALQRWEDGELVGRRLTGGPQLLRHSPCFRNIWFGVEGGHENFMLTTTFNRVHRHQLAPKEKQP
jgi:hypothetical protein